MWRSVPPFQLHFPLTPTPFPVYTVYLSVVFMRCVLLATVSATSAFAADAPIPDHPTYNRDVRPILADNCFRCHGFDKNTRKADLRLDVREAALAELDGAHPIVPGKPDDSELWRRITTKDEDDVMPPLKEHRQLNTREKAVLKKWIEQGAEYQPHWAYIAPAKAPVPADTEAGFSHNTIDAFLLARYHEIGVTHAPQADRGTLCRRLHLDLLGRPPNVAEVTAFVEDQAPDAYEKLVDRLLASPQFGERMAVWWLDLVRYADSIGYHSDNPRNVWPYRDYVIRSFNDNKPFDRFTIEQLAGDLLPDASVQTRVASGYNRLILTTEEGGAQPKQYEAKHVTDRVKSIGTTWLAQTFMCCECHDHKYDPVTTRDFYSLGAFFADIKEASIGRREDGMFVPLPEQSQKLQDITDGLAALRRKLAETTPALEAAQSAWEKENVHGAPDVAWSVLRPSHLAADHGSNLVLRADSTLKVEVDSNAATDTYKLTVALPAGATGLKLEVLPSDTLPAKGPGRAHNGNFVLNEITCDVAGKKRKFSNATATFEQKDFPAKLAIDGKSDAARKGWAVLGNTGLAASAYFELETPVAESAEAVIALRQIYGDNHTIGKFRLSATTAPKPIRAPNAAVPADVLAALQIAPEKRDAAQKEKITAHYHSIAPELQPLRDQIASAEKDRADLEKSFARCLVSESGSPRTVRILPRGDWMSDKGDVVEPATPHFLPGAPQPRVIDGKPQRLTRLDLAHWLVSRENPLTARVFVNRLWKQFYGGGISKTLEDMGTQSELPTMQPLLDWLAVDFMDRAWDVKGTVRLLVTSGAYRMSSIASPEQIARDPLNRDFARQGRWRLDAEFVRDNALSISELLTEQIGGPSVKPYQPAGYWENLNFPTREWENDQGPNQWRRGLYTWWQRSYVHPAMLAFDAPTREECAADRVRSNIPQQSLVLLNDPEFVEAARAFAALMIKEGGPTPQSRIAWAWQKATARTPKADETNTLLSLFQKHLAEFQKNASEATALDKVGISPAPKEIPAPELAAYTSLARVILNLHETVTRL